jgi:hypothetical protein
MKESESNKRTYTFDELRTTDHICAGTSRFLGGTTLSKHQYTITLLFFGFAGQAYSTFGYRSPTRHRRLHC